ncbi:FkbM family methyltransferase [Sphingomonas arantia]|uniref:FkbM family methyltransferase n=1 Tax=Sphingomonas arantia TaxID=1460676 RepID=A0ABW4U0G1_9SPHN
MLNSAVGSPVQIDGRDWIQTANDRGHAVYGPYLQFEPGRYVVEFALAPLDHQQFNKDFRCAVIDVVAGTGTKQIARREIRLSNLQQGMARFVLPFTLKETQRLEFRVWVNGKAPLLVADERPVVRVTSPEADPAQVVAEARFPEPDDQDAPEFFVAHREELRQLHRDGAAVRILGDNVVLRVDNVSFFARTRDDFNFVGEVFFRNAYNIFADAELCVVDIGMNIGLVSMMFAAKPNVQEVHSFEPFRATFDRALANFALNPDLSEKITAHNIGLSDHDRDGTIAVSDVDASGSMCIVPMPGGTPVRVSVRDTATMLRPVIEQARAAGRKIVLKVDCEGSEFAVFESLEKAGLLDQISAFMVEWHRIFDSKTQADLVAPLLRRGFLVFDQSPPHSNGFFYAVRMAA